MRIPPGLIKFKWLDVMGMVAYDGIGAIFNQSMCDIYLIPTRKKFITCPLRFLVLSKLPHNEYRENGIS